MNAYSFCRLCYHDILIEVWMYYGKYTFIPLLKLLLSLMVTSSSNLKCHTVSLCTCQFFSKKMHHLRIVYLNIFICTFQIKGVYDFLLSVVDFCALVLTIDNNIIYRCKKYILYVNESIDHPKIVQLFSHQHCTMKWDITYNSSMNI